MVKQVVSLDERFGKVFTYEIRIIQSVHSVEAPHRVLCRQLRISIANYLLSKKMLRSLFLHFGDRIGASHQELNSWVFAFPKHLVIGLFQVRLLASRYLLIIFNVMFVKDIELFILHHLSNLY